MLTPMRGKTGTPLAQSLKPVIRKANVNCPKWLESEGKAFFKKHSKALTDENKLDERNSDSFALLCQVWALIRATDPLESPQAGLRYIGLIKQYQAIAKMFGLMPNLAKGQNANKPKDLAKIIRDGLNDAAQDDDREAA